MELVLLRFFFFSCIVIANHRRVSKMFFLFKKYEIYVFVYRNVNKSIDKEYIEKGIDIIFRA